MLDAYPDTFTFVQTHLDAYTIPWGSTRAGFYGIAYTPTTWFDGVIERVSPYSFAIYQSFYNTRRAVPTDVTIELSGELVGWRNIRMRADVCVEAGGVAKTMRVHMVQVLDNWPIPPTYSRNGLKQAADYQDVFVSPGQCQEVENVFAFDSDSWSNRDDIQIIAWAQETDASGPAEVHQAAFKRWPLAAVKGDFDDDTRVNLDDYPDFADCLAGPGTAPSPTLPTTTQRCLDVFDFDEDGDVDLMDHRGFQSAFDVPGIIYVDADAGGDNDGSSWQSAYTDLHGALAAALPIDRIWVAAGVYTPAGPGGDRTAGFQLPPDVPIYGGFAGFETGLDQRDYVANPTVLSGDLNGDDTPGFDNVSDNSYHVVRMDSTSDASVLDGFTITGGNADGTNPNNRGAGILNDGGDGNLINCTVLGNRAKNGAGMVNLGASPTLINVGFSGNDAFNAAGGGMNNDSSTPVLINCTFSLNHSGSDGGGIYNKNAATLTLVNSILWGNSDAGGTDESAQLTNAAGTSTAVDYSCLQGWTGALGGTGNTGSDPALADPGGLDDIAGTLDDDFRLTGGSPVIDQGNTGAVPDDFADIDGDSNTVEQLPWDLDGNPRITGTPAEVDMGAYEY